MRMSRNLWIQTTIMNHSCSTILWTVRRATSRARSFQIARSRSQYKTQRTVVAVMPVALGTTKLLNCLWSVSTTTTVSQAVSDPALKSLALVPALGTDAEAVIKIWSSTRRSLKIKKANRTKTSYVCPIKAGERPCMAISWIWAKTNYRISSKWWWARISIAVVVILSQWAPWEPIILRPLSTQWVTLTTRASPRKRSQILANLTARRTWSSS